MKKHWKWSVVLGAAVLGVIGWLVFRPGKDPAPPDLGIGLELVYIRRGTFRMGPGPEEARRLVEAEPQKQVTIDHGFFMGRCEVTQRQWRAVMGTNPSRFPGDDRPVERVSYHDAVAFCKKLSERTGWTVRLPTEVEWEYACRAGTTTAYAFGEELTIDQANFQPDLWGQPEGGTRPVGSYPANAWGLRDLHGNVWEWCEDRYEKSERGPEAGEEVRPVVRGGGWSFAARDCRSAHRDGHPASTVSDCVGFRVVVEAR